MVTRQLLDTDPSPGTLLVGRYDLQLGHAEAAMVDDHFPSCLITPSHSASATGTLRKLTEMTDPDPSPFANCHVIVCYGGAGLFDKHLASTIHCVDDEIIGWLQRREQRRRARAVMPPSNPGGD